MELGEDKTFNLTPRRKTPNDYHSEKGEVYDELLITGLLTEDFDVEASNMLKNRMKLEEFSGYRSRIILQEITVLYGPIIWSSSI